MDSSVFDGLTRAVAEGSTRRRLLGSLSALALGGAVVGLFGLEDAEARRKGKKGKRKGKGRKRGKKKVKRQKARCTDGVKNGAESDVDCGGGTCPRCQGGQTCNSRNDCHTALCAGGTCQSCDAPTDCGLDSNGDTCFCRENAERPGEKMCTRKTCKLFTGGTCVLCLPGEQCAPAGPDAIECCAPCGS